MSNEEIIKAIKEHSDPLLETKEVAELIGLQREGARKRLHELREDGRVDFEVFGDTYAWYIPE